MPHIIPFRGFRYDQGRVDLADVVAPPYDIISPELQSRLYAKSPYNVVRLILGRESDRYSEAAKALQQWQTENILVRDPTPSIYVLHQTFTTSAGRSMTRKGFIALCRLEEFEKKIVLPHEKTLSKPLEDRLRLFKSTNANFSQVLSLYSDVERSTAELLAQEIKEVPVMDVTFEDVQNRVWQVTEPKTIRAIQETLSQRQVFIADGHHRYETALAYRNWRRGKDKSVSGDEPFEYVMMFFSNFEDEGLVIEPTHRIVHSLPSFDAPAVLSAIERYFVIHAFGHAAAMKAGLAANHSISFGLVLRGSPTFYLATLKPTVDGRSLFGKDVPAALSALDVTILHQLVLGRVLGISAEAQEQKANIDYVRGFDEAIARMQDGRMQAAFIMNPPKIEQVAAVAEAGSTMPQKSTYFYPKLLTGLVLNVMAS